MKSKAQLVVLATLVIVAASGAEPLWGLFVLLAGIAAFLLPLLARVQVAYIRRDGWRALLPLLVLIAGASYWLWLQRSFDVAFYTEFERFTYRGEAIYDGEFPMWHVNHTLLLDSTQVTRIVYLPAGREEPVPGDGPTVDEVLRVDGWNRFGREGDKILYRYEGIAPAWVPYHRMAKPDSIIVPTLGRRLQGFLVFAVTDGSAMSLVAPSYLVLGTYPAAVEESSIVGTGDQVHIVPIPYAEDRLVALHILLAGPLFRNYLGNLIATGVALRWLLLTTAALLGFDLQRRLLRPGLRRLLDTLGLPDHESSAD